MMVWIARARQLILERWKEGLTLVWRVAIVILLGAIAYQLHGVNEGMRGTFAVDVDNDELKVNVQADAQHPLPVVIHKDASEAPYLVPVPFGPGQPQLAPISP